MKVFKHIFHALLDTLLPRSCSVCGKALVSHEKHLCTGCILDIPCTRFHEKKFNEMEQLFAGKTHIEKAMGYFYYEKGSPYANILHNLKYRNEPLLGKWLASEYAKILKRNNTLADIDCIIPIPLHYTKLASRGYNQSEFIAQGFGEVLNVPVITDIIEATKSHESQTRKGIYERYKNTQGIYKAIGKEQLAGKHVLIVDDVVTTGATLLSAAQSIANVPGIKISLATLAVARLN